jgi:hypothetical protein
MQGFTKIGHGFSLEFVVLDMHIAIGTLVIGLRDHCVYDQA